MTSQSEDTDMDDTSSSSDNYEDIAEEDNSEDELIKQHSSYEQIMLDVNRCAGRLQYLRKAYFHRTDNDEPIEDKFECSNRDNHPPDVRSESDDEIIDATRRRELFIQHRERMQKKNLANLIVKLLIKNPDLHYYQGFHDVCLTYMTILGYKKAYTKLVELVTTHFSTFMQPTMNETQDFLALIPVIVGLQDSKVQKFLESAEVGTIFALSWVITWFSHVIPNEHDLESIFSFLENKDPHMVLYICAEIILHKKIPLLQLEPEMSTVHHYLCQVPRKENLPFDVLLPKSVDAFERYPPELVKRKLYWQRRIKMSMQNYSLISRFSTIFGPILSDVVSSNAKTAILVIVLASAFALQFDRWTR